MSESAHQKRPIAIYLILAWMSVNGVFMVLELTVFGDATDLNNSLELILWVVSIAGLASTRKWGVALPAFTLTYTLSTSMNNIIYYSLWTINGPRVVINAIAIVYLFKSIFAGKFK
jgi:hypothetical protein